MPVIAKSRPVLSVVVVALDAGANLARCLQALNSQEDTPEMEILVAHDDRLPAGAGWEQRFPGVRLVFCPHRRNYPALRSAGVREARGDIIAATEDQCIPPPRWCANVVVAHQAQPAAAIGGPVDKLDPDSLLNWSIYLREFGEYTPPLCEGPSAMLTDCNVTYKRRALEAVAEVWREEFHEPQVHGALRARGEILWLSPRLLTIQQRSFTWGFALRERYRFGRLYGWLRLPDLSPVRRALLIVASPLLPFVLVGRVLLQTFRKGKYVGVALLTQPCLLLFSTAWVAGELVSYLTGRRSP